MMRKCHLNTCPVGIATQDPVLRKRFTGQPEHVINYFFFVAEEVRELMAKLGFRTFSEMIGRVDKIDMVRAIDHWKAKGIDLSRLLYQESAKPGVAIYNCERQQHHLDKALDNELIAEAQPAIERREPVRIERPIRNVHRTVGAMLSGEIARRYGHAGLPQDTIWATFRGTAGQSFGAFLAHGVALELYGDANDYTGKGLSGGRLIVRQPSDARREPTENIIIGNTVLYGAIAGEAYFEGVAGERFAVRNSGAVAVVEGTGDHACEYMTGGVVLVIGDTGRNFAAGMSGGIAYVWDPKGRFASLCNRNEVDLEPIAATEPDADADPDDRPRQRAPSVHDNGMGDPLRFDAARLRILLERHYLFTGSARAHAFLEDWGNTVAAFLKITPKDYRRALLELQAERLAARTEAAE
jgi:glutamate synthase (NADPH/NADH) large chain